MAGAHCWRPLDNPLVSLYMLTSASAHRFFQQAGNDTIREQLVQEEAGGGGGGGEGGHGMAGLDGVTSDFLRGH